MYLTEKQQSKAWELAAARHAMPSALSSREQREAFSRDMRRRVHVMARVSSATFASEVKTAVDSYLAGDKSKPVLIAHLQGVLARLGYSPEHGFPGDAALGIPPALPGSLRDLSAWKRLELIIDTEGALAHGKIQQMQDYTPVALRLVPAYEMIRVRHPKAPRNWPARWNEAGGPPPLDGRFIAPKEHEVWHNLGDHAIFNDALGVDHAPFWFNSSGSLIGMPRGTCMRLGIMDTQGNWAEAYAPGGTKDYAEAQTASLPPPLVNAKAMDPAVRAELNALFDKTSSMLAGRGRRAA